MTELQTLCLAIWLGGLVAIDMVAAPARFAVIADRNLAAALGRATFARWSNVAMVSAGGAVLFGLLAAHEPVGIAVAAAGYLALLANRRVVQPGLLGLSSRLDFQTREGAPQDWQRHRRLHRAAVLLDLAQLTAAAALLLFPAALGRF
jgi:uncharacterized membrane protein